VINGVNQFAFLGNFCIPLYFESPSFGLRKRRFAKPGYANAGHFKPLVSGWLRQFAIKFIPYGVFSAGKALLHLK